MISTYVYLVQIYSAKSLCESVWSIYIEIIQVQNLNFRITELENNSLSVKNSTYLKDNCLLKGEFCNCVNPLNEVCLWIIKSVAWGLATANGFSTGVTGTGSLEGFNIWGSVSLSVMVACLKLPCLVNALFSLSTVMDTAHSLSRCCFFSRQMANAQPTAWLRRSP